MIIKKVYAAWLLKLIVCTALVVGLAACSSNDDDGMTPATTDGATDGATDNDSTQEVVNEDGTSTFVVPLSAGQEVPPVVTDTATGEGNLTIDRASGAISGSVSVSGLSGQASAAHIHQGQAGTNGGPLVTLTGNDGGTLWSVPADTVLDAATLTALGEGGLYLNVHTAANAGGELRGQIIPDGILLKNTELSGDQEVPPITTDASGVGVSTVNSETGAISATIFISGLDAATAAHIHAGAQGTNGDPIIVLDPDSENPGIWRTPAMSVLSETQIDAFTGGALYFNVHSDTNPGGEVRGQL